MGRLALLLAAMPPLLLLPVGCTGSLTLVLLDPEGWRSKSGILWRQSLDKGDYTAGLFSGHLMKKCHYFFL